MARVLLIEDDAETASQLTSVLVERGYHVSCANDGIDGLDKARAGNVDVIVLDRMLPGMDGLAIIEALRKEHVQTPVLVLSALGAVDDRIRGLRMGSDDYLTKPFVTIEFLARMEALLRRPADNRETKVLLIEDESETAREIVAALVDRGYVIDWATNGIDGLDKARTGKLDLMIVDRLLPGMDGLAVVEALRREGVRTPVLVLSALRAVDDCVRGLRKGGDDYLTKPFAIAELLARCEALLRRPPSATQTALRVGPLKLDLLARKATRGDRVINLLPREFRLLEYMMRRKGQLLTRAMLFEEVWNYKFVPRSNLVDVHLGRLRRKVDAKDDVPMIHSIRGEGFMLCAPD
jgi:two-component system, OmpR family, response regulator